MGTRQWLRAAALGIGIAVALGAPLQHAFAGDGSFPSQPAGSPYPAAGAHPFRVAIGDFNADGNQDLAVASGGPTGVVTIRLGAGDGTFATEPLGSPVASAGRPTAVAAGDFDGDGKDDLAILNGDTANVSIRLGAGDGTFGAIMNSPAGPSPGAMAVGDFNGDGNDDLAVSNAGTPGKIAVLLGDGHGLLTATPGSPFGTGISADGVAVGDFNRDGAQDLAVTNPADSGVAILIGAGDGDFPSTFTYSVGPSPSGIAVGDLNGDGIEDLAIADFGGGLTIRLGSAAGEIFPNERATTYGLSGSPARIALGDFNSDGLLDLATADPADAKVSVRLGAGDGTFQLDPAAARYGVGGPAIDVAVGDFNEDGSEDLAVPRFGGGTSILLGGGGSRLAGNLLTNGSFEGPGAAQLGTASPAPIPGWQTTGNMMVASYDMPTNLYLPDLLDAARIEGGENYLYPGFGADSSAFQTVSVADAGPDIDLGTATATLSADLGGGAIYQDRMSTTAEFLDANGGVLGSFAIGPVTVGDRQKLTELLHRTGNTPVPVGTRSIRVTVAGHDDEANYDGASADNVKLTVSAPGPVPPPLQDTTPPDTDKGKGPKHKLHHRKTTFEFSSEDPAATFTCQLDSKPAAACTSPVNAKHLRHGKHAFTVTAIDAAGNADQSPARWKFKVVGNR
jgi:FG-GAP-like repeat/FG-GAP repeat